MPVELPSRSQWNKQIQIIFDICSKSKYKLAETDQIRPNQIKGQRKTNTNNPNQILGGDQIIFVYVQCEWKYHANQQNFVDAWCNFGNSHINFVFPGIFCVLWQHKPNNQIQIQIKYRILPPSKQIQTNQIKSNTRF